MIGLIIILCLGAVSAAPQYGFLYNPRPFHHHQYERMRQPFFGEDVFDTGRFWSDLSSELHELDNMLADFYKRFPTPPASTQGIDGQEYKITIPLTGYDEKDIVVKARRGLLMIQAVHKLRGDSQNSYMDVRTLPDCVNVNGSWTYNENVLNIVFPLLPGDNTEVVPDANEITTLGSTDVPITQAPTESREEIDNHVEVDTQDADVGVTRGDTEKERQLLANEILRNKVEATTYAVDLKDDVEFVPVFY